MECHESPAGEGPIGDHPAGIALCDGDDSVPAKYEVRRSATPSRFEGIQRSSHPGGFECASV